MLRTKMTWFTIALVLSFCLAWSCTKPTNAKTAQDDFCKARAAYKLFAATQGGKLDPAPGSPRAKLEASEDAFCAEVAKQTP